MVNLSVIVACGNSESVLEKALQSVAWVDELIIVVSDNSCDSTLKISQKYTSNIYVVPNHLGKQRNYGINKARGKWILILDADERIIPQLQLEIIQVIQKSEYSGFLIPYRNYFLGHELHFGNQSYAKLRLFKKKIGVVEDLKTHPEIKVYGKIGTLTQKIDHYSFQSLTQILKKFTFYACEDLDRLKQVESPSFIKIITYPLHLYWTLFITEQGYKDGIWGFLLAVCFMYYELVRYFLLWKSTLSPSV